MGFHFPSPKQWLTHQFIGNRDYTPLKDTVKCMKQGTTSEKVLLNFGKECDKLKTDKEYRKKIKETIGKQKAYKFWWNKNNPTVTLPFYGRFWRQLLMDAQTKDQKLETDAKEVIPQDPKLEYSTGKEKSWSAVWATMWMHGRFQGFTDLERDAAETAVNGFRRNLGGLKGEYTLGPLTIPAHFGTPEDKQ